MPWAVSPQAQGAPRQHQRPCCFPAPDVGRPCCALLCPGMPGWLLSPEQLGKELSSSLSCSPAWDHTGLEMLPYVYRRPSPSGKIQVLYPEPQAPWLGPAPQARLSPSPQGPVVCARLFLPSPGHRTFLSTAKAQVSPSLLSPSLETISQPPGKGMSTNPSQDESGSLTSLTR